MTRLLGWIIIALTFSALGLGLLYPGYRVARRHYPASRRTRPMYAAAALVCGAALWFLLPVVVHRLFPRF
jgi:hypothetical protein